MNEEKKKEAEHDVATTETTTARERRMNLIQEIEFYNGSRLVTLITGDRQGLQTRIAYDLFPLFHRHLMRHQTPTRIDLFLYSRGGVTMAGYALVKLIREFCDQFSVIVPFRALSTATLIALGANKIIMTKMGQLSPIDPSVRHPLAPSVGMPGQPPQQPLPVSVEDAAGFVALAKDELELEEESSMQKVLELLAAGVHPLVLGAIQRSRAQIGFLASQLMQYHTDDQTKIEETVGILTKERFSHEYIIDRTEAKNVLKLPVVDVDHYLMPRILALFQEYDNILMLGRPYNPELVLGNKDLTIETFDRAIVESEGLTNVYRTRKEIKRIEVPQPGTTVPATRYQERILQDEWVEDDSI